MTPTDLTPTWHGPIAAVIVGVLAWTGYGLYLWWTACPF